MTKPTASSSTRLGESKPAIRSPDGTTQNENSASTSVYTVLITDRAKRDLSGVDAVQRQRIAIAIDGLATVPRPAGIKAMKGDYKGHFRLRVGDFRVLYLVKDAEVIVVVVAVGNRREVYR